MKTSTTALSAALALALGMAGFAPQVAHAANAMSNPGTDGTITITGEVIAQTCAVDANASGTSTGTVTLPSVLSTNLANAGDTAGKTPFTIDVTGCATDLTTVQTLWDSTGTNVNASGRLDNAGSATNVEVELLNDSGTVMDLNQATASAQGSQVATLSTGGATLSYTARYYATGQATGGSVDTSVNFTLIYQ